MENLHNAMLAVELNARAENLKELILKTYMGTDSDDMDTAPVDIN